MDDLHKIFASLDDNDSTRRIEAAEKLLEMGPEAGGAAVALVRAMGDENEEVRELAAAVLEEIGPPPQEVLPQLIELLENRNMDVAY